MKLLDYNKFYFLLDDRDNTSSESCNQHASVTEVPGK